MRRISVVSLLLLSLSFLRAQNPIPVTQIFTNFTTPTNNGLWNSSQTNGVVPNNLHSLLAFRWNGNLYSTGVDNAKLNANSGTVGTYNAQNFQALPPVSLPGYGNDTYIGVGSNYGGGDGNITPVPVTNNLIQYLVDGVKGLGLGTAVYNFPGGQEIKYKITGINPSSINDGIPDVIFSQVGQIGSVTDRFKFINENSSNSTVGIEKSIDFSLVNAIGNPNYKFYKPGTNPPAYQSNLYGTRPLRVIAFDWSEFGITSTNYTSVTHLIQHFSGQSDVPFTGYNTNSMGVEQSISGNIYNDNNAGTPDGNGYGGATIRLYNATNTLVNTVTSNANGAYIFPNVVSGTYRIELTTPSGFTIVGATDGNTDNIINVTLGSFAVLNQNFGINQPPSAVNNSGNVEKNTPFSINISTNDTDPNSGAVVPSTINLIPPTGATNITTDANGRVKSFSVANVGSWSVNNSGVLTFTPVTGFVGTVPMVQYTINDTAGLTSNAANINLTMLPYCTKIPTTTTGGTPSKFGITIQTTKLPTWPENVPNGHIVMESTNKGFVITRVQNSNLITDAKEGMMIYDINAACIKIYNGTSWKCIVRDCNQ